MLSTVTNTIRSSVKQCASPKKPRFKSTVVTCPFGGASAVGGDALDVNTDHGGSMFAPVGETLLTGDETVTTSNSSTYLPFSEMPSPGGVRDIPVIGPLFHFKPFTNYTVPTLNRLFNDLHDKYGKIYRLRLPGWMVVTEDPDDMEMIFRNEGQYPVRPTFDIYRAYSRRKKIAPNVGHVDGEQWKRLRGRIQKKLLRRDAASKYITSQSDVADELVLQLKNKALTPYELKEMFFKFSVEAIAVVCFDQRLGFLSNKIPRKNEEYLNAVKEYFSVLASHLGSMPLYKWFPTPMYKKFELAADIAYSFAGDQARKTLEEASALKKAGMWDESQLSFSQAMLGYEDSTHEELTSMMQDLMIGGTDSTAKIIEAMLYQLALNPDKQKKLYEEVHSVIGRCGNLEADDLDKMSFLRACVKETYRLQFPTPVGTGRVLQHDLVLGGYHIPKGVTVMCNNPRLLKNPKYFEDSEKFVPERWMRSEDGQRPAPIPPMALKPFGFGVRSCVGQRFAEQELLLAISKIIQNFEVTVIKGEKEPEVVYTIFATFSDPVEFQFHPR